MYKLTQFKYLFGINSVAYCSLIINHMILYSYFSRNV